MSKITHENQIIHDGAQIVIRNWARGHYTWAKRVAEELALPAQNIRGMAQASASPIQATRPGSSPGSRSKVSAEEIQRKELSGERVNKKVPGE